MQVTFKKHLAGQHDQGSHGTGGEPKKLGIVFDFTDKSNPYNNINGELSREQAISIKNYTGDSFTSINNSLRKRDPVPWVEKDIKNIDEAMKVCRAKEDIAVFRGMGPGQTSASIKAKVEKDGSKAVFADLGFVSTSTDDFDPKKKFGGKSGIMMQINVKKGAKCIAVGSMSEFPRESEILLNRGALFKFNSIRVDSDGIEVYIFDYIETR